MVYLLLRMFYLVIKMFEIVLNMVQMSTMWLASAVLLNSCYIPHNKVVGGYIGFTMSVRPSVDKSYVVR
jgi:hypothetical protein